MLIVSGYGRLAGGAHHQRAARAHSQPDDRPDRRSFGRLSFSKLNVQVVPDFWGALITATIGALVFLLIWQAA